MMIFFGRSYHNAENKSKFGLSSFICGKIQSRLGRAGFMHRLDQVLESLLHRGHLSGR
jgi:hypothetical protein